MRDSRTADIPLPRRVVDEMSRAIEDHYPKAEWEGIKFQALCSANVFDFARPAGGGWSKAKTDAHRRIKNTRRWIEHFCRIQTKAGEIEPIILNAAQRKFLAKVLRRWRKGEPARVVILKPRQTGFCYDPAMKILMADMTWVPIGEVEPGRDVVAFDEESPRGKGQSRRMRRATVVARKEIRAEAFRVTFTDGRELIVTGPHRHLCRTRGGTGTKWVAVQDMRPGDVVRSITHGTWAGPTPEGGWMGGLYDGEGHIRAHPNRKGVSIGVCQVAGAIWNRALAWLGNSNMRFKTYVDERRAGDSSKLGSKDVHSASIHRISDIMRFAGTTGSVKLTVRDDWWNGRTIPKHRDAPSWAEVASIEPAGERAMVDLQTTEGTYVCEGFASHNSTVVELLICYLVVTSTYKRGEVIAHKRAISSKVLNMFRRALKFFPFELATNHRTRYEVVFDEPLNCAVDVDSAESDEPGHGDTLQYLHLTEVSRWKDARRKAKGVMQTVPNLPGTLIVWESTANGAEGYFYELYFEALDTENPSNRMDAVFVAWYEHEEYTSGQLSEDERAYIAKTLTAEEERLLGVTYFVRKRGHVKVAMGQIAWRRDAILNRCGGNLEDFQEQYPATDMEAFLASGRPVFSPEKLVEREQQTQDPIWRGDISDPCFTPREVPDDPGSLTQVGPDTEPAGPRKGHVAWPEAAPWPVSVGSESEANQLMQAFGGMEEQPNDRRDPDQDPQWS